MKILVADDDLISLMAVEKCLRDWGYEVITAKNGTEAWEIISQDASIQIIILDWMMPGLDGISLTKKIKNELNPEDQVPRHIIMLSGTDGYEEIIRSLTLGADDYLVKPFSFNELHIRLKRAEKMLHLEQERRHLSSFDPLTMVWNRRKIVEFLEEELARGLRNFHPTGLLLLHVPLPSSSAEVSVKSETEKRWLQELASQLKENIRCYDKVGRFSSREFLIILPQASSLELRSIAQRLSDNLVFATTDASVGAKPNCLIIGGVSTDIFSHPSTAMLLAACQKAVTIARHQKYPNNIYIIDKKEVATYERRTDSR